MDVLNMLLLLAACGCFALAAVRSEVARSTFTLIAAGLLLATLVPTIAAVRGVAG